MNPKPIEIKLTEVGIDSVSDDEENCSHPQSLAQKYSRKLYGDLRPLNF